MPAIAIPTWAAAKAFFGSKKFLIPAAIVLILLAIGGGTYWYLTKQTDEKVELAVKGANQSATIQTHETNNQVRAAADTIDMKMDKLRDQTTKDYEHVRSKVAAAPVEQKTAPVPPLIIDTLNELDRLRALRATGGEGGALTTKFRSDELVCKDAPVGQLPYSATAEQVSTRIAGNDEAGEDCRQKLARARMKIEITDEIIGQINAGKKPKLPDPK